MNYRLGSIGHWENCVYVRVFTIRPVIVFPGEEWQSNNFANGLILSLLCHFYNVHPQVSEEWIIPARINNSHRTINFKCNIFFALQRTAH